MITIGIDIDDTMVQTNKRALEIIKREGFENVDYYEKLPNLSGFINDHFVELVKTAPLFEKSKEVIEELRQMGFRIVLISSRAYQEGADTEEDTVNYLKENGIIYDAILLRRPNKVEACIQEKVDYFIDDKEKTLDTLAEIGIECIKMQSIDKNPSKYNMVNTWDEILLFFKSLKEKLNKRVLERE